MAALLRLGVRCGSDRLGSRCRGGALEQRPQLAQGPVHGQQLLHLPQDTEHLHAVDGFGDKEVHPGVVGLRHHVLGGYLGEHDKVEPGKAPAGLTNELDAVHAGHQQVHQHQVRLDVGQVLQGLRRVFGAARHLRPSAVFQDHLQNVAHSGVIINEIQPHGPPPILFLGCEW